jgi:hypothetical protein
MAGSAAAAARRTRPLLARRRHRWSDADGGQVLGRRAPRVRSRVAWWSCPAHTGVAKGFNLQV